MILSATALEIARTQVGIKESGGKNRGPEVDEWLRRIGLAPPQPWCAAWLWCLFDDAAKRVGMTNPVPRTASSQALYRHAEPITRVAVPHAGCVYVLQHTPTSGHVGIVESVDDHGVVYEISANTFNDVGGREGNCVARHRGDPAKTHGGVVLAWLDFNLAAQHPNVIA